MLAGVQWIGWLLSLLAALLLTGYQYLWVFQAQRKAELTERRWYFPIVFRFLAWMTLFILLQGPWIKMQRSTEVKPRVVICLDSSESITTNDQNRIQKAAKRLEELLPNWSVERRYFGADVWEGDAQSSSNLMGVGKATVTNFQRVFEHIQQEKYKYGLEAVVMMTDGIANDGLSPQSLSLPEGVLFSAIGVGDTNQYADVFVKSCWLNKEIFLGNSGEVEVVVGVRNSRANVTANVFVQGELIGSQTFIPEDRIESKRLIFSLPKQSSVGLKSVKIQLSLAESEKVLANNFKLVTFSVVDNKKTIGLLGESIDPDMGAIKRALDGYDLLECKYIDGFDFERQGLDAIVLFGVPIQSGNYSVAATRLKKWMELGNSIMIIPKKESDLRIINELSSLATLTISSTWQESQAVINSQYSGFTMDQLLQGRWLKFPPLQCPLQNFTITDKSKVMMYQRWSGVETEIPMQWSEAVGRGNLMVCLGSGFWRWGLVEQKNNQNQDGFQQWLRRGLGVLTSGNNNKERLSIVLPSGGVDVGVPPSIKLVYRDVDGVVNTSVNPNLSLEILATEKSSELKKQKPIKISLQKTEGGFLGNTFPLNPGIYKVSAEVTLGTERFLDNDLLEVNAISKEKMVNSADLDWLRKLADSRNGSFAYLGSEEDADNGKTLVNNSEMELAVRAMSEQIKRSVSAEKILKVETRNWYWYEFLWLFLGVVGLLTLEWSFRKWLGKY